jgi:hypothetical protein
VKRVYLSVSFDTWMVLTCPRRLQMSAIHPEPREEEGSEALGRMDVKVHDNR